MTDFAKIAHLLQLAGWSRLALAANDSSLYTFSFLPLLYFAVFSVASARERGAFWSTMPSTALILALAADALGGTVPASVGLPGLTPLPWWLIFGIFVYAMASCLVVNDAVKVALIRWRIPELFTSENANAASPGGRR